MENLKILCGANSYVQKFYINPAYDILPQKIKDELKIMCVTFANDVSGLIILEFNDNGDLRIVTSHSDDDFDFDEIGCELKIQELQREKKELFEQLEEYYDAIRD